MQRLKNLALHIAFLIVAPFVYVASFIIQPSTKQRDTWIPTVKVYGNDTLHAYFWMDYGIPIASKIPSIHSQVLITNHIVSLDENKWSEIYDSVKNKHLKNSIIKQIKHKITLKNNGYQTVEFEND